jgi:hypothetical protein
MTYDAGRRCPKRVTKDRKLRGKIEAPSNILDDIEID